MKKVMMIVLLTVVPSALRAEVTAGNSDLGAAREKASVQFDRLTAKDAGSAVVLEGIGSSATNDVPLVISESKKKDLSSAVPMVSEKSGSVMSVRKDEGASTRGTAAAIMCVLLLLGAVVAPAAMGFVALAAIGGIIGAAIAKMMIG